MNKLVQEVIILILDELYLHHGRCKIRKLKVKRKRKEKVRWMTRRLNKANEPTTAHSFLISNKLEKREAEGALED